MGDGTAVDVDTRSLEAAGRALAAAARSCHDARPLVARATDGAGWAVDGLLPSAVHGLGDVLEAALARLVDDAREAAAMLALAASRYAEAEAGAVRSLVRDAPASRGG